MQPDEIQRDLLFCRRCASHYGGQRRTCPTCAGSLELVEPFKGRPGDLVDERYRLLSLIGIGGMGSVYRAHDLVAGREVAIKVLNARYASHAASARWFFAEARMMRRVRHPGVAALHRFGPTPEGMLVIDMEYVPGESVRERVVRLGEGVEMGLGLNVLDSLLAGLAACHDNGVVHCDIKPENIMLVEGGGGRCKLVDFGIAQSPGEVEQGEDFVVLGTPAFMSPEQVRGQRVDHRTDLYLVGCLTYELLTGEPPFVGDSAIDLCHQQMLTDPPRLSSRLAESDVPHDLQKWALSLLEKNPESRPVSTRAVREDLRRIRVQWRESQTRTLRRPRAAVPQPANRAAPAARQLSLAGTELEPSTIDMAVPSLRAFIEVRQVNIDGTVYGPRAIEEIINHVFAGALQDLRELGAQVAGAARPHLDVRMSCEGDERGAISHILDVLAQINEQLARIPEPQLEIRAAVVSLQAGESLHVGLRPELDLVSLLNIGPGSHVRVDERIARWAGRRPIVRLASIREPGQQLKTLYATALQPTG